MPTPLTPAQLRALAVEYRAEADEIELRARLEAGALRVTADEFEDAAKRGLTIAAEYAKLRRMSQPDLIGEMAKSRKVGRPIEGKHALHDGLKRVGMTMSELARVLGKNRNTVKSWVHQAVPMAMAKRIETILGIPATLKSWPAGIQQ